MARSKSSIYEFKVGATRRVDRRIKKVGAVGRSHARQNYPALIFLIWVASGVATLPEFES